MPHFELFKVRVERPSQRSIDEPDLIPAQLIEHAINERPYVRLRGDTEWHIGNVIRIDETGLYFRFGKTISSVLPVLHEGDFRDIEMEEAPYTHCVIDVYLQACAIMHKPPLASYTPDLASRLQAALNTVSVSRNYDYEFVVLPINDPESFISQVEEAYRIKRFSMSYRSPNPWDEDDFRRALESWYQELDATKGRVWARGNNLNKRRVIADTHATAASGDEASAALQKKKGGEVVRKYLRGNPASFTMDTFLAEGALSLLRETYHRIRRMHEE